MAGEFEVTKLYARIVPKLAPNFKSDLQRQINVATKTSANRAVAKVGVEVSQGSLTAAKQKIESQLSKARAKVKFDIDQASVTKANKAIATIKNRTVKIKVELVGYALAKKQIDSLGNNVTKRINVKSSGSSGSIPGGAQNYDSRRMNGFAGSVDALGRSFGRMSDLAGIAGVAVSGAAKIIGTVGSAAADASKEGFSFASSLGGIASSIGTGAAVGAVAAAVLVLVSALAAGTLAAVGFSAAAVVMGAIVSALAVGLSALASAASVAIGAISGLAAGVGVALLAIAPVASAFGEFLNVQGEAPKATNAATKAVTNQAKSLRSADSAIRSAGRAIKDANKEVADSGYAIVRAQRSVRDAGENLNDAYRSQLTARQRLNEAEEKAKENLEALSRAARDAAGQEEDAEIRLIRAGERLAALNPLDDDSTDYREALRDVEQAERDLADQRKDNKKTEKEYQDAKKKGIKGDKGVIDARRGILEADRAVRDAQEAALDAEKSLADARFNQSRSIDAQKESLLRFKEAQLGLTDANDAGTVAYDGSTAAQRKMNKQFGELTKQGQRFFETLKGVYEFVLKLSGIAQDAFLPGLNTAFEKLMVMAPLVEFAVKNIGKEMGDLAVQFADVFASDSGQLAFDSLMLSAADSIKVLGGSTAKFLGTILPQLAKLADAAKPLTAAFGTGLETIGKGLGGLFESLSNKGVIDSMAAVSTSVFNVIGNLLTKFGSFMEDISKAMSKLAPNVNDGLDKLINGLFDTLSSLINSGLVDDFFKFAGDLGTSLSELSKNGFFRELGATMGQALRIIGESILDLMSDPTVLKSFIELFQVMPPLIRMFLKELVPLLPAFLEFIRASSELTLALGPDILLGIATALGSFAKAIDLTISGLEVFQTQLDGAQKNFALLIAFVSKVGVTSWQNSWAAIRKAVGVAWAYIRPIFMGLNKFFTQTIPNGARYVAEQLTNRWTKIKTMFVAVIGVIKNKLKEMRDAFVANVDRISVKVNDFRDKVKLSFNNMVDGIKTAFDRLKNITIAPVQFVVNTVYNNGLRKVWNGIAGKIGLGSLDEIKGFARGGQPGGKLSGNSGMQFRDDRLGLTPNGPVKLAGGEYIVNARSTKKYLPLIQEINKDQVGRRKKGILPDGGIPGFGIGGFLGDLYKKGKGAVKSTVGALGSAARGALNVVVDPAIASVRKILPGYNPESGKIDNMVYGVPHTILDKVSSFVKKDDKKNALTSGSGNIGGYQRMFNWVKERFPYAQLFSGLRNSRTLSGNASLHNQGRAIDITPSREILDAIIKEYGNNATELISPWQDLNRWHGKPHKYSEAVERQHGSYGSGNDHIHWAMKNGGPVTGLGGRTADRIKRYLSNGEFVMNAKATSAIGASNLANANQMAISGASRRNIRANTKLSHIDIPSSSDGMVDNSRYLSFDVTVSEEHHADLLASKLNSML